MKATKLAPNYFPELSSWLSRNTDRASELPVLVQMNALPEHHRPKSDDPDFWGMWSSQDSDSETIEHTVVWKTITDDWQHGNAAGSRAKKAGEE